MSSGKWRPFCLGLNVLNFSDTSHIAVEHDDPVDSLVTIKQINDIHGWNKSILPLNVFLSVICVNDSLIHECNCCYCMLVRWQQAQNMGCIDLGEATFSETYSITYSMSLSASDGVGYSGGGADEYRYRCEVSCTKPLLLTERQPASTSLAYPIAPLSGASGSAGVRQTCVTSTVLNCSTPESVVQKHSREDH